jgi:hypothetical protein
MILAVESRNTGVKNLPYVDLVHHESSVGWPGIERRPLHLEAGK